MITQLRGRILETELTDVALDVNGVGYALAIPMSTYDKLPPVGTEICLFTHLYVREDGMFLYGFASQQERQLFRLLITVSGVGPRLALNILSCMTVTQFCETVANADIKALSRVSGIGKRSGERLVVELRERVKELVPGAGLGVAEKSEEMSREIQDAVKALETLGFKGETARNTVRKIADGLPEKSRHAENLIRKALASLNS